MKTKDSMQISLQTHPNGYGLTVNGEKFMYLNLVDLMAGFMAHVGLGFETQMEKGTILSSLMAAMLGDAYTDAVTTLKQRVGLLTSQYTTTIEQMDKAIDYVAQAEKTISGLTARIENIETQLKATEVDHAKNKKAVDDVAKTIVEIEKKAENVFNSLSNSATIMKAMEEAGKADEDNKGKKGNKASKKDDGKPTKTSRQKRDEAILEKMNENPNIK